MGPMLWKCLHCCPSYLQRQLCITNTLDTLYMEVCGGGRKWPLPTHLFLIVHHSNIPLQLGRARGLAAPQSFRHPEMWNIYTILMQAECLNGFILLSKKQFDCYIVVMYCTDFLILRWAKRDRKIQDKFQQYIQGFSSDISTLYTAHR